jgi:uncharacterized membrane protein YbhN (UPF0104 family)
VFPVQAKVGGDGVEEERVDDPDPALGRALDADARWVAAAAVFELLSFTGYIALLWLVARRATARMGLRASTQMTLGGAAATRLLPAGGLGGIAMTIWALRRAGLSTRDATQTLLAFLVVLYSVFLAMIVVAGGLLALGLSGGDGPLVLSAVPATAAGLTIVTGLLLARYRLPDGDSDVPLAGASRVRRTLGRVWRGAGALGAAVRAALAVVRQGDPRLLGALAWWTFDAAVLWAMMQALGTPPALAIVVLGYFVGQIANTLPIPGAVSGGMVGVLLAFGVEADLALASVLAYRATAIWLPTPIGLLALRGLRATIAEWSREDARVPSFAPPTASLPSIASANPASRVPALVPA